ncbi:MAG: hypothetical protein ACI8P0_003098 [Planctomycetaceae bacterium]|jgi:hypothetical protein
MNRGDPLLGRRGTLAESLHRREGCVATILHPIRSPEEWLLNQNRLNPSRREFATIQLSPPQGHFGSERRSDGKPALDDNRIRPSHRRT